MRFFWDYMVLVPLVALTLLGNGVMGQQQPADLFDEGVSCSDHPLPYGVEIERRELTGCIPREVMKRLFGNLMDDLIIAKWRSWTKSELGRGMLIFWSNFGPNGVQGQLSYCLVSEYASGDPSLMKKRPTKIRLHWVSYANTNLFGLANVKSYWATLGAITVC